MPGPRITRIYLEKSLRESAEAGRHNFLNLLRKVLEDRGMRVEFNTTSKAELLKGALRPGYSLIHMKPPVGANGLVFRRAYHYPFWQIDRTDERWNWRVAQTPLPDARSDEADSFFRRWRGRLFPEVEPTRGGFIYVPLQGLIREHRSFQSCSPIDMLRHIRSQRPDQRIVATLHPKEHYDAQDRAALGALDIEVEIGQMDRFLPQCDVVATMNSSAAFNGFFLQKPAILYGKIDFHHIALRPEDWDRVDSHAPDYAHFIHWFWQQQSINAGHGSAKDRIAAKLDAFGWPK